MRQRRKIRVRIGAIVSAVFAVMTAAPALAESSLTKAVSFSGDYRVDVAGVVSGGLAKRGRVLDDLKLVLDADLDSAIGWKGAQAHIVVLNNSGGQLRDDVGALQGVNNIEVPRQRARLFEAWVEQGFGDKGSVRAGLYDLNSEFYVTESSALLIGPAFGIGSELDATGPRGPSIFPSTALSLRARWTPNEHVYVQAALINAHAGVPGDPGGVNTRFDDGLLTIAEAGWLGRGKVAFGAWRYTKKQGGIRDPAAAAAAAADPSAKPAPPMTSQGAYILLERQLTGAAKAAVRKTTVFTRLGVSDGDTSPFKGGWQAGFLVERVFAGRPESALSVGVNHVLLAGPFRAHLIDEGQSPKHAESIVEATYSDKVGRVTIQPDLQYVINPAAHGELDHALVATVRLGVSF